MEGVVPSLDRHVPVVGLGTAALEAVSVDASHVTARADVCLDLAHVGRHLHMACTQKKRKKRRTYGIDDGLVVNTGKRKQVV